jgi:sensor histidine kinase YesM
LDPVITVFSLFSLVLKSYILHQTIRFVASIYADLDPVLDELLILFFNVFQTPVDLGAIIHDLQICKPVLNLNLILFPKPNLTYLPEIKTFHIRFLCFVFNYCQHIPTSSDHRAVISITVLLSGKFYAKYT